jgi:excisionase family DNA binding protein
MDNERNSLEKLLTEIRDLMKKQQTIQKIKGMVALTIKEVQEVLPFSEHQIRYYAEAGQIPARKLGRHWLFSTEKLQDWVNNCGIDEIKKLKPRSSKRIYRPSKKNRDNEEI